MAMFKRNAEAVPAPSAKKKGKEKEQLKISGLQQLTILDALIKQASAMQATLKAEATMVGFDRFVEIAGKASVRPSSFEGIDGHATASVEIRKRSSASVLTEDETKVLVEAGLKPEEKVTTPFQFYVNPTYASDDKLLAKVEAALAKIVPEDFIIQQQEVKKNVVNDEMLDTAFKEGADEAVLRILTTMAIKPKLSDSYDMNNLLKDAVEIMQPSKVTEKVKLKSVK